MCTAPQLFISLGTGQQAALLATIVTGVVNHFATYVSLWAADSFGRRFLFLEGGVQMAIALVRHLRPCMCPAWTRQRALPAGSPSLLCRACIYPGLPWMSCSP